jgi:membrane protein
MSQKKGSLITRIKGRIFKISLVVFFINVTDQMNKNNGIPLAAAIAYYGFLSIFPLLLGIIGILGYFLPSQNVQQQILYFVQQNAPGISEVITSNIQNIINARGALSIIGILGFLWSGSAIFSALDNAINRAHGITKLSPIYIRKPRDIGLTIGTGILFLISNGASYAIRIFSLSNLPFIGSYTIEIGSRIVAFLLAFLIFLILFKLMPNVRTYWRYVWPGTLITAILFEIGRNLFFYFVNNFSQYTFVYGTIGSIIAVLVLIYYSAIVLIIGVEITAEYSRIHQGEVPTNYIIYSSGIST